MPGPWITKEPLTPRPLRGANIGFADVPLPRAGEGELARAVGLGGRDRKAASHAERARLNATRAIRAAMTNLAREHPALGQHLTATIRTGRYCSYTPDPRTPVTWAL
jgi:hypothetical protein